MLFLSFCPFYVGIIIDKMYLSADNKILKRIRKMTKTFTLTEVAKAAIQDYRINCSFRSCFKKD